MADTEHQLPRSPSPSSARRPWPSALLQSLVIPAIPQLEQTLHTSESGASWLLTAYLLSAAIATPILGRVGDMAGKEKSSSPS